MVLVVLAIAGSLLAVSARRTSERALEAGAAQRELQRKWGMRSIQTALLPRAEAILEEKTAEGDRPRVSAARAITLGDMGFAIVVGDEQAKANVNLIVALADRERLRGSISILNGGRWLLPVVLRPVQEKSGEIRSPPVQYASLEQVFAAPSPADLLGKAPDAEGPAARLTCWGNGKLNFRRAEELVLRVVLSDILDEYQMHRLCVLREEMPEASVSGILGLLELEKDKRALLQKRVTDASSCHSLWIVAQGRTRNWCRLIVRQQGDEANDSGLWTFAW